MSSNKTESVFLWLFFTLFLLLCMTPAILLMVRNGLSSDEALATAYSDYVIATNKTNEKVLNYNDWIKTTNFFLYNNRDFWILFFTSIAGIIIAVVLIIQVWKLKAAEMIEIKKLKLKQKLDVEKIFMSKKQSDDKVQDDN